MLVEFNLLNFVAFSYLCFLCWESLKQRGRMPVFYIDNMVERRDYYNAIFTPLEALLETMGCMQNNVSGVPLGA